MSHDQKPGRMRVVGNAAPPAQRRRGDAPGEGAAGTSASPQAGATPAPAATVASGKSGRLLALLFMFGCAAGGVALPLLSVR